MKKQKLFLKKLIIIVLEYQVILHYTDKEQRKLLPFGGLSIYKIPLYSYVYITCVSKISVSEILSDK